MLFWTTFAAATEMNMADVVNGHRSSVIGCDGRFGEVRLRWRIAPDGQVDSVEIQSDTARTGAAACLARESTRWNFGTLRGNQSQAVRFGNHCAPSGDWELFDVGAITIGLERGSATPLDLFTDVELTLSEAYSLIGAEVPDSIVYYHYENVESKKSQTGKDGNAHACRASIHTTKANDRHEIMHVASGRHSSKFLNEGLAVWFSRVWQGRSIMEFGCEAARVGAWTSAPSLLENSRFAELDARTPTAYGIAGAIVHTAIEEIGWPAFWETYRSGDKAPVFVGDDRSFDVESLERVFLHGCPR